VLQIVLIILIIRELFGIGYPKKDKSDTSGFPAANISEWWKNRKDKKAERERETEELGKYLGGFAIEGERHLQRLLSGAKQLEAITRETRLLSALSEIKSKLATPMEKEKDDFKTALTKEITDLKQLVKNITDEETELKKLATIIITTNNNLIAAKKKKTKLTPEETGLMSSLPILLTDIQKAINELDTKALPSDKKIIAEETTLRSYIPKIEAGLSKAIKDITDLDTYKSDALKRGTYTATLQKDSIDLLNNCTKIEEVYRLGILNYITDFTKKFTERTSNSAKLQLQIDAEIKKITTPGIIKP